MGTCISNRKIKLPECEIIRDVGSPPKEENISALIRADTASSSVKSTPMSIKRKGSVPAFLQPRNNFSGVLNQLPEITTSTRLLAKPLFLGAIKSMSLSPSATTLETFKTNTNSSLTCSPSTYWRDVGDILSFDGVNQRICNRYDIGLRMLKAQIQYGADPNVLTTHGGRSCLMFAVLAEDLNFVKKLVGLGVDVNKTTRIGETALSLALGLEKKDIARYLRINGAVDVS